MYDVEVEVDALIDMLRRVEERLENAARAGREHDNEGLANSALSLIPLIRSIEGRLLQLLSLIRAGSWIVAREEACNIEKRLWSARVSLQGSVPPYFRLLVFNTLDIVSGYVRRLCSMDTDIRFESNEIP